MKFLSRFLFWLPALALAACSSQPAPSTTAPEATPAVQAISEQEAIAVSDRLFQALVVDQGFAKATTDFDETMKSALPESQLKAVWEGIVAQFGTYQARLDPRILDRVGQYIRVATTLKFEKADLDMRVVVDSTTGLVSGLFFTLAHEYQAPAYVDPDTFEESDITIGEGEWELPGTLTLPKGDGPFPAVVLVHGSGPNDRDETVGANKPFKDLAWGLASRGIAVLRYDKRTLAHGAKFAALENGFTVKE